VLSSRGGLLSQVFGNLRRTAMTRSLLVLVFVAASLAQPLGSPTLLVATAEEKKDQDLIQGSWKVVKREVGGKVFKGPFREDTWAFKGNQLTLLGRDKELDKFTFVLGPDKKPKTIKMTGTDGVVKGKTIFGIYRIERDTLMLTQSLDGFPKNFGGPGKKTSLLTFKRLKP
jgi:uncharacterized protein (TIGR03067 family)